MRDSGLNIDDLTWIINICADVHARGTEPGMTMTGRYDNVGSDQRSGAAPTEGTADGNAVLEIVRRLAAKNPVLRRADQLARIFDIPCVQIEGSDRADGARREAWTRVRNR